MKDMKILLVEDSPKVLHALQRQMELAGFKYLSVKNGQEAMEVLENERGFCLIISDWLMPKMTGFELLTEVRRSEKFATIPFLMVTGKDSVDDVVTALRFGANDYITKPYHPEELLARVRNLLKIWRYERELEGKTLTDDLTGLHNRRHFEQALTREIAEAKRYGTALSLVLCDIDHFKKLNDDHGHLTGDEVLRGMGALIRQGVREVDYPCRYGGEEFALILPHTDCDGAMVAAERLRKAIAQDYRMEIAGRSLGLTCSFGVAQFEEDSDTMENLIDKADKALYRSKQDGRNRVSRAA